MTSAPRHHNAQRRVSVAVLLAAACGLLAFSPGASAHHAKKHHTKPAHHKSTGGGWSWSKPFELPGKPQVDALSCATTALCVATGDLGNPDNGSATDNVYWSTNPGGGTSAWQGAPLEPEIQPALAGSEGELLDEASCETAGSGVDCALIDGFANIWQTADPTGGAGAWGKSTPTLISFVALSCWSAWCGELDVNGDAVVTLGASATSLTNVFPVTEGLSSEPGGISCNASAFCATVDGTKEIAWTTNADGSPATWQTGTVSTGSDLDALACPSTSLCVAVEGENGTGQQYIGVSTNPAGGPSTWKAFKAKGGIYAVTCQSTSLCVVGGSGQIYTSTDPASASPSAWKHSKIAGSVYDLSCPTATECVANVSDKITVGHR